ncbi:ArnT family glycosyltransferase [Paenibacillus beijingensis]|uniref:Glycosyltransferase RgtA/B/C/D-like domain-containing protein n=1 Tax=Paenibacillus beijingensis TaxID=1126833 RepID=A0A0D5NGB8_9BACL|nr:hypothetical protein [Paenibacillus beijingensis]AJY73963.1 hypothetical protein VN24_04210 [Paenibacillus beijingensis]
MIKTSKWPAILVGLVVFTLELVVGIWMAHVNLFLPGDALSRVANAYYVLYSRDPHLGAIGFIWNPLPSLLEIPILLFKPLLPELATEGLVGVLLTSSFAAATAVLLFRHYRARGHSIWIALTFVALFSFNPFIFLYGSNGMSEILFIFFLVWAVTSLLDWMDSQKVVSVIFSGFALAFAFLTRYETVAFGAFMALGVALIILRRRIVADEKQSFRVTYHRFEATELIFMLPVIYTGLLWILLNYTIMGDPLYFLRSNYSNIGQSAGLSSNLTIGPVIGNLTAALRFSWEKSVCFLLPLIAIIGMRLTRKELFRVEFFLLLLMITAIPIMQVYMLYKGSSYGWFRFFVYPLPMIAAWLPYELQKQKSQRKLIYILSCLLTFMLLVSSSIWTGRIMQNATLAQEEYEAIHFSESSTHQQILMAKQIASDLDQRIEEKKVTVLMDSFVSFWTILYSKHPDHLVITSDRDFAESLLDPVGSDIDYILVPKPEAIAALEAVNQKYGDFYFKGTDFAVLDTEYGDKWRLFRVIQKDKGNQPVQQ